ncbi:hypothetical protein AB0M68_20400 [Streptomyces sp. NPDC051453]|uniref:alpha-L-rhamnosidase-related protein n=1 Tax=Streptomyces sp. NPDC051453 TaxID=3154941 RepID=UPI0034172740
MLVPWELYETYDDRRELAENWDAMVRWVEWALAEGRADLALVGLHPGFGVALCLFNELAVRVAGLWFSPLAPVEGTVPDEFLVRQGLGQVLGREDDAARYARLAKRIKEAWRTEFLDDIGRTTVDTQASYVRALAHGLAPEKLRDAAAARRAILVRVAVERYNGSS